MTKVVQIAAHLDNDEDVVVALLDNGEIWWTYIDLNGEVWHKMNLPPPVEEPSN